MNDVASFLSMYLQNKKVKWSYLGYIISYIHEAVKNKFSPLISSEDEKQIDHKLGLPADNIYNAIAKASINAAEETIPRKTKCKKEQFKLVQKTLQENLNEVLCMAVLYVVLVLESRGIKLLI